MHLQTESISIFWRLWLNSFNARKIYYPISTLCSLLLLFFSFTAIHYKNSLSFSVSLRVKNCFLFFFEFFHFFLYFLSFSLCVSFFPWQIFTVHHRLLYTIYIRCSASLFIRSSPICWNVVGKYAQFRESNFCSFRIPYLRFKTGSSEELYSNQNLQQKYWPIEVKISTKIFKSIHPSFASFFECSGLEIFFC